MNEFIRIYICVGIVSIHNSSWSLADNKISNIYRMCSQFTCERQLCVCIDNNIHFERKIARSGPAAINSIYSLLFDGATNILVNDNNVFSHRLSAYRVARTSNSTSVFGGFCIFFRFVFWVRKYFFLFTRDSRIFFFDEPDRGVRFSACKEDTFGYFLIHLLLFVTNTLKRNNVWTNWYFVESCK